MPVTSSLKFLSQILWGKSRVLEVLSLIFLLYVFPYWEKNYIFLYLRIYCRTSGVSVALKSYLSVRRNKAKLNMLLSRTVLCHQWGLQWSLTAYNVNVLFTPTVTLVICLFLCYSYILFHGPKCFNQPKNRWINWEDFKGQGEMTPCAENVCCWCLQFWDVLKSTIKSDSKENICESSTGVSELCFPRELISAGTVLLEERNTIAQITTKLGERALEREMMPGAQHRNLVTTLTLAFPILFLTLTPHVHLWQPLDHQTCLYTLHFSTLTLWHQVTLKCPPSFSLDVSTPTQLPALTFSS